MSYDANIRFQHCVAPFDESKGDEKGTRISIVFRNIKNILDSAEINKKIKDYNNKNSFCTPS
jgi:hypothetical protein